MSRVGALAGRLLEQRGYELRKRDGPHTRTSRRTSGAFHERCAEYTMTPVEAMYATYRAVQYVVRSESPGDIVECGVWRGGHAMLAGLVLEERGDRDRQVFLYDTFEGMVEPGEHGTSPSAASGQVDLAASAVAVTPATGAPRPSKRLQANVRTTGLDTGRFHFVKGKVEETIPATVPDRSRCCAWIRTGTSRPTTSFATCTRGSPRAGF